jgi:hypothetical protein
MPSTSARSPSPAYIRAFTDAVWTYIVFARELPDGADLTQGEHAARREPLLAAMKAALQPALVAARVLAEEQRLPVADLLRDCLQFCRQHPDYLQDYRDRGEPDRHAYVQMAGRLVSRLAELDDIAAIAAAPGRSAVTDPEQPVGGNDPDPFGQPKGGSVNQRMLEEFHRNPDSANWSQREWATQLGCVPAAVAQAPAWQTIRMARAIAKTERLGRRRPRRR